MPTYEYACTTCGHHLDAVQSFSDDPLTTCELCGGKLRKVFGTVGIVLKGSGFYKTDSRAASESAKKRRDKSAEADGVGGTKTPEAMPNIEAGAGSTPAAKPSDGSGRDGGTGNGTKPLGPQSSSTKSSGSSGTSGTRETKGSKSPAPSGASTGS